ncbi:MAG: CHRD domain-containing protein [Jiangellaceae bacterium]|nr:CHRD domain-containing protein [Jiangellaceae bacterium]
MRTVLFLGALVMGLTVAGPASAVIVDDGAPPTTPVLTPQTFTVQLQPSGDADGSGTAELIVDLRSGTVCYDITVTGIGEPTEPAAGIGSAHIHSHARNGAIAVDLKTQFVAVADAADTYLATGCVTATRRVLVDILLHPEQYYVNVHTVEFPGGAVQGDLA